jgi:hypothetical protein
VPPGTLTHRINPAHISQQSQLADLGKLSGRQNQLFVATIGITSDAVRQGGTTAINDALSALCASIHAIAHNASIVQLSDRLGFAFYGLTEKPVPKQTKPGFKQTLDQIVERYLATVQRPVPCGVCYLIAPEKSPLYAHVMQLPQVCWLAATSACYMPNGIVNQDNLSQATRAAFLANNYELCLQLVQQIDSIGLAVANDLNLAGLSLTSAHQAFVWVAEALAG